MKKKWLIITGGILAVIAVVVGLYFFLLAPTSRSNESVKITITNGMSKKEIVNKLKEANLIKNTYAAYIYIVLNGKGNLQAGEYDFSRDMGTSQIIDSLANGKIIDIKKPSVRVLFPEGITLKEYMQLLADNTDLEYDTIIKEVNDEDLLKEFIKDYWFLTDDILNKDIYYALEGYLFPETYDFYKDTTLKQALKRMLDETEKKLKDYKTDIENSGYSVHEILTMASIAEKEANSYEDRTKVSQVIYKRLSIGMSLGMDVTAYYGVGKNLKENNITKVELNDENPYNTRLVTFKGLPVGPICNPGISSIKAVLNPADTEYIYFFADINTGIVYFTDNESEFNSFKKLYS